MSRVRKSYIKGNLKVGFEISGSPAQTHAEGVAVNEENLVLGVAELVPQSIKKWISISDEAMDLRGTEFLDYIYDELAYRIAKKAADMMVAQILATDATGSDSVPAQAIVTANTIAMGTVAQAIANLSDEAANPVLIMNKLTWSEFKRVQYANGYGADPFEGLPVVFNDTIPAFSAASTGDTYLIVGDLDHGALANFPAGQEITFKYDDMTLATQDLVRIIGREFVALGIVAPKSFVQVQK
jgi:HK97 family phage major capsid protein